MLIYSIIECYCIEQLQSTTENICSSEQDRFENERPLIEYSNSPPTSQSPTVHELVVVVRLRIVVCDGGGSAQTSSVGDDIPASSGGEQHAGHGSREARDGEFMVGSSLEVILLTYVGKHRVHEGQDAAYIR